MSLLNTAYELTNSPLVISESEKKAVVIASGEGVLKVGTLVYKPEVNTLVAQVGTGGINASVTTIPLKAGFTGTVASGSIIQIGTELIVAGTIGADSITGCTRGYGGSTSASHLADATITINSIGTATETYKVWDGLTGHEIEGIILDEVDATSVAVNTAIHYGCNVNRALCLTKYAELPVPKGLVKNSLINFIDLEG